MLLVFIFFPSSFSSPFPATMPIYSTTHIAINCGVLNNFHLQFNRSCTQLRAPICQLKDGWVKENIHTRFSLWHQYIPLVNTVESINYSFWSVFPHILSAYQSLGICHVWMLGYLEYKVISVVAGCGVLFNNIFNYCASPAVYPRFSQFISL